MGFAPNGSLLQSRNGMPRRRDGIRSGSLEVNEGSARHLVKGACSVAACPTAPCTEAGRIFGTRTVTCTPATGTDVIGGNDGCEGYPKKEACDDATPPHRDCPATACAGPGACAPGFIGSGSGNLSCLAENPDAFRFNNGATLTVTANARTRETPGGSRNVPALGAMNPKFSVLPFVQMTRIGTSGPAKMIPLDPADHSKGYYRISKCDGPLGFFTQTKDELKRSYAAMDSCGVTHRTFLPETVTTETVCTPSGACDGTVPSVSSDCVVRQKTTCPRMTQTSLLQGFVSGEECFKKEEGKSEESVGSSVGSYLKTHNGETTRCCGQSVEHTVIVPGSRYTINTSCPNYVPPPPPTPTRCIIYYTDEDRARLKTSAYGRQVSCEGEEWDGYIWGKPTNDDKTPPKDDDKTQKKLGNWVCDATCGPGDTGKVSGTKTRACTSGTDAGQACTDADTKGGSCEVDCGANDSPKAILVGKCQAVCQGKSGPVPGTKAQTCAPGTGSFAHETCDASDSKTLACTYDCGGDLPDEDEPPIYSYGLCSASPTCPSECGYAGGAPITEEGTKITTCSGAGCPSGYPKTESCSVTTKSCPMTKPCPPPACEYGGWLGWTPPNPGCPTEKHTQTNSKPLTSGPATCPQVTDTRTLDNTPCEPPICVYTDKEKPICPATSFSGVQTDKLGQSHCPDIPYTTSTTCATTVKCRCSEPGGTSVRWLSVPYGFDCPDVLGFNMICYQVEF